MVDENRGGPERTAIRLNTDEKTTRRCVLHVLCSAIRTARRRRQLLTHTPPRHMNLQRSAVPLLIATLPDNGELLPSPWSSGNKAEPASTSG